MRSPVIGRERRLAAGQDGPHVGQHLQLLSNYFIGYSVTWHGSVIGLFYGALAGAAIGWAVGAIYNRIVDLKAR